MNKAEMIAAMAKKSGLTKKDCEAAVSAYHAVVGDALMAGDKVQIVGYGSYEIKERAARTGRNPKTKEKILIPASKMPVFKAGKALKDAIQ